jgi:hypothetical protein
MDRGVRDAASFGFTQLYNPQAASYQIISATEQVNNKSLIFLLMSQILRLLLASNMILSLR